MPIRVHNTGQRKIQFGPKPTDVLHPGKYALLDDDVAKKHIKMFPGTVIDIDNAMNSIDSLKVEDLTTGSEAAEASEEASDKAKSGGKKESGTDSKLSDALKAASGVKSGGKK